MSKENITVTSEVLAKFFISLYNDMLDGNHNPFQDLENIFKSNPEWFIQYEDTWYLKKDLEDET